MAWKILFFRTVRGVSPVQDFIEALDANTYAKIIHSLELLENYGPYLKPPYIKKLKDKLYELRITGKVPIRIFYIMADNKYYLLHVIKKKSQKTPSKDLKLALDRAREII